MTGSKFTGEQIALAVPSAEAGGPMADICWGPEPTQFDFAGEWDCPHTLFSAAGSRPVQPRAVPGVHPGVLGPSRPSPRRRLLKQ